MHNNNFIETTLPLSPDNMVAFFNDKSQEFMIDYEETRKVMTPKSMLIYLSNLQVVTSFDKADVDIFIEYLYVKDLCNIPEFEMVLADLLYYNKYSKPLYNTRLFEEYREVILADHAYIINFYCELIDSIPLYMFVASEKHKDVLVRKTPIESYGLSFLNLFKIPDFLLLYFERIKPLSEQVFFEDIFEVDNYMFKGKNLFYYIANKDNAFFSFMEQMSQMLSIDVNNPSEESINALNTMVKLYSIIEENNGY